MPINYVLICLFKKQVAKGFNNSAPRATGIDNQTSALKLPTWKNLFASFLLDKRRKNAKTKKLLLDFALQENVVKLINVSSRSTL